jgi:hypothetical protein
MLSILPRHPLKAFGVKRYLGVSSLRIFPNIRRSDATDGLLSGKMDGVLAKGTAAGEGGAVPTNVTKRGAAGDVGMAPLPLPLASLSSPMARKAQPAAGFQVISSGQIESVHVRGEWMDG